MAINKVVYGDQTLVDLTQDSVEASNLLEGETAHDRSGSPVTGTAKQGHAIQDSSGTGVTQRNTMQFKGMTVTDDATNGKTVVEATKTSVGLGNVPNVTTDNQTPTVTEASTRANLAAGDTLKTIIGKIKKFFTDLKTVAFSGDYTDLNNTPTIPTDFVSKANGGTFGGTVKVDLQNGGADNNNAWSGIYLGNNIPKGTAKHSAGYVRFFGHGSYYTDFQASNSTSNRFIGLPNKDGTVALTSDIPTITRITQNVSVTANDLVSTNLDFDSIDTSKILMVQVTWSNTLSDVPTSIVYYAHNKPYINKVNHKWSATQTVTFYLSVLHT